MHRLVVRGTTAGALCALASVASADDFDVENFHVVSPGDGALISVHSTRQATDGDLAMGLSFGIVDAPLVVVDMDDERVAEVISSRFGAELGAAYGLGGFELSAALPVILHQQADGDAGMGLPPIDGGGLGDLRLTARRSLLGGDAGGAGLGAGLMVTLPTSIDADFGGQAGPTAAPFLVADWHDDRFIAAANLGARLREQETLGDLTVGSALTYGVGAGVRVGSTPAWAVAELAGEAAGGNTAEAPLEVRGALHADITGGFTATAGYGRGLVHGYGAPDHRVFAGVVYRPARKPVARVVVAQPEPPREPATPPPNPDPDGDGILGDADGCPKDAEDFDGYADHDGCPETDNDSDGLADSADACPNHPEDVDGFQDGDGCPDPDNDLDGIADAGDKCPDQPEVINGNQDDDGCPDEGKRLVLIGESKLEIQEKVYFANGKDTILPRSEPLLYQLAKTLERSPWIKRVRIEGHTDNRGNDTYNQQLSERRAAAVRQALIDRGIAADRLESVGYGEAQPIDSNKKVAGRAHNRRVELVIVEQDRNQTGGAP